MLAAARLKTEALVEGRQHVILEAVGRPARVRALIHLEAVRGPVPVEGFMQFAGVGS